ncbi:hypothetical protein [Pedobacter jamesrossensis]|uniref:Uncharacterized protein n=1 Tax=Pedobacter jamesrossensis TaxID=1908238 RepID=A0ABV8NRG3_9SPHI
MIIKKELLSENLKDYMDYSMEMMKSLDGAPEHTQEETASVNEQFTNLQQYLENLRTSYNETAPAGNSATDQGKLTDIIL